MEQYPKLRWLWCGNPQVSSDLRNPIAHKIGQGSIDRLTAVLESWRGTKYIQGASVKGVGADCIGFVAGVIDELYGLKTADVRPPTSTHRSISDCNAHLDLIKYCRRSWPSEVIESDPVDVSPGDVLVCKVGRGPGHIYMVGPRRNTAWHCVQDSGVTMAGWAEIEPKFLIAYRLIGKDKWMS